MNRCIFCNSTAGPFTTREHILPESLGGGDWAILPPGLYCDVCQNVFGSSIEQQALADYPFNHLRVLLGIPTKKRKAPWFDSWEGKVQSALIPGYIGYDPSPEFADGVEQGRKTQMRLVAEPRKPQFTCRTLLKMGLELIAADNPTDAYSARYDEVREYALYGTKSKPWWYLQVEDLDAINSILTGTYELRDDTVSMGIVPIEDGAEVFRLTIFYLEMLCPLDSRIIAPPMDELESPKYRLFVV